MPHKTFHLNNFVQEFLFYLINLPLEEAAKFVNKPKTQPLEVSPLMGDVALSCEVASPTTTVVWKKEHKEIAEDNRVTLVSQGTQRKLVIKGAKQSDEGHYSCETVEDKVTFRVKIQGKNQH